MTHLYRGNCQQGYKPQRATLHCLREHWNIEGKKRTEGKKGREEKRRREGKKGERTKKREGKKRSEDKKERGHLEVEDKVGEVSSKQAEW